MTWNGVERRTNLPCGEMNVRMTHLERRCDIKETEIKTQSIQIAQIKMDIEDLKSCRKELQTEMDLIVAWKNKAIGYLTFAAMIAGLMADQIKNLLSL